MLSNPRDLAVWYPLVPPASGRQPSDTEASILSACIYAELPPMPLDGMNSVSNVSLCELTLVSLTIAAADASCTASVDVCFPFQPEASRHHAVSLPLLFGRSASVPYGSGYVLMRSKPAQGTVQVNLGMHMDCLVLMQQAPYVNLWSRNQVESSDGVNGYDASAGSSLLQSGSLDLEDGHNAEVSWSDGILTLTAADGAGKGVFTVPPYTDVSTPYASVVHKGLRSVNGTGPDIVIGDSGTFTSGGTLKGITPLVSCSAVITVVPVMPEDYVLG